MNGHNITNESLALSMVLVLIAILVSGDAANLLI